MAIGTQTYYYRGQGKVYAAEISAVTGLPTSRFFALGNVPELSISQSVSRFEHQESQTGKNLTDLVFERDSKASLMVKMEELEKTTIEKAFYGSVSNILAGTVTAEPVRAYLNGLCPLNNINLTAFTSLGGATATAAVTVTGGVLSLAVVNGGGGYSSAPVVTVTGAGGTGAAFTAVLTNGIVTGFTGSGGTGYTTATVAIAAPTGFTLTQGTDYTINLATGSIEFPAVPANPLLRDGTNLVAAYTRGASSSLLSYTATNKDLWLRFEGLNSAQNDSPVVVDIPRFRFDPAKQLQLISQDITSIDLEGNILYSPALPLGISFFRERFVVPT